MFNEEKYLQLRDSKRSTYRIFPINKNFFIFKTNK